MPDVEPAVPEAIGPPVVPGLVEGEPHERSRSELAPGAAGVDSDPVPREREVEAETEPGADSAGAGSPAARPKASGNRIAAFIRASWAELQRVQWPDRRQVGQATAVVLGFVVIAGSFLGLADLLASNIVDAIL